MPSASAKPEKQASTEVSEPIKQAITIIEHKIRNLQKRKSRLEACKDQQSSGKQLNSDQLAAIAKYDEVQQVLEFAQELCKRFNSIALEAAKQQKKQEKRDAFVTTQQELAKVKEVLVIQDVLANMGQDTIRNDFLNGRNNAIKLTEEDLQHLDDLFVEVSPKREMDEGVAGVPFPDQLHKAAKHLLNLVKGKTKEVVGTTYAQLRQRIQDIHTCGYFDGGEQQNQDQVVVGGVMEGVKGDEGEGEGGSSEGGVGGGGAADGPSPVEDEVDLLAEEEECHDVPLVQTATFRPSGGGGITKGGLPLMGDQVGLLPPPQNPAAAAAAAEVISSVIAVTNSSFHFLQDSELDSPDVVAPTAPPPSALPIPTQTFTNHNFVPAPTYPPHPAHSTHPHSHPHAPHPHTTPHSHTHSQAPAPAMYTQIPPQPTMPTQQQQQPAAAPPAAYQQFTQHQHHPASVTQQQQPPLPQPPSDWSSDGLTVGNESNDWNIQCEEAANAATSATSVVHQHVTAADTWQQPKQQPQSHDNNNSWGTDHHNTTNSSSQHNDGFVPAAVGRSSSGGGSRGRSSGGRSGMGGGSRYRGGGGPRPTTTTTGGRGGGGYYNKGGDEGGSNYYHHNNSSNSSNSFQGGYKRGSGGPPRIGGGGHPRSDRGGPRGGGRGGGGGRTGGGGRQ